VSAAGPTVRVDISGLDPGGTVMFPFERDGESLEGFILRHEDAFYAYVNRCAHVTLSLDVGDGNVMDEKRQFILCSAHGARYLPESGECFMGPVVGRKLQTLPVSLDGDFAEISIVPCPAGWPGA
jgi:nitrite reductase/ring-hydroxylating ferredoxin subunit